MAIRFSMSQDTFMKNSITLQPYKPETTKRDACLQDNIFPADSNAESIFTNGDYQPQSNCECTNISVMQLFHEMKQEFPTIPDHVVSQHVLDNCHDRENCKQRLQSEVDCHLVPVQAYPAQLIRILNKKSTSKKRPQSKNTAPPSNTNNSNCRQNLFKNNCKVFLINDAVSSAKAPTSNSSEGAHSSPPDIEDMRSGLCNIQIKTYLIDQNKLLDVLGKESPQLPVAPQRPTTLRLNQEPYSNEQWFDQCNHNYQTDSRKSNGKWSSPVSSPNQSQGSTTTPPSTLSSPRFETSYNTTASIQSPSSYSDSRKAEISVNVSLSPSSYRNRSGPPQRHHSSLNVRPELPFTRNIEASGTNHKSYTSVNLVLRQPSSSPQSPIDITVGPNITYSSSSYHPGLGYQNNYHITVTDDGGVFSAFRIHPIRYYNPSSVRSSDRNANREPANDLRTEAVNNSTSDNSVAKHSPTSGQSDASKIIMRQRNQMEKLSAVLRKNKNKLGLVRKEVKCVMQSVNIDELSERLDSEIEKLRCDCQAMLNELENSPSYGLPIEDSIEHTNSIKSRQQQPFPKQKPHRFPPPSPANNNNINNNNLRKHQRSFPIAVVSPRQQQAITYHDDDYDEPSDFGVGD